MNPNDLQHPDENHRKRAVQALATTQDPRGVALLAHLAQHDPSESVRGLAREALQKHKRARDPLLLDDALIALDAAEESLAAGARIDAANLLRRALSLDPTLPDGAHAEQVARVRQALESARTVGLHGWRSRPKTNRVRALVMLSLIMVLAFAGLLPLVMRQLQQQAGDADGVEVRQVGDVAYYLARPDTPPPDEGYPLLVALPGLETTSTDLIGAFAPLAQSANVLVAVPEYTLTLDSLDPTVQIDAVLGDVRAAYAVDARGAVLFGVDVGGDVATRYVKNYFGVVGVVTADSDDPALPPQDDTSIVYLMLYPTMSDLAYTIQPRLDAIRAQGNEVRFRLVDAAPRQISHEIAAYAVNFTAELLGGR